MRISRSISTHTIEKIIAFLQDSLKKSNLKCPIFGLSGGIDSAVVAKLCKIAFKQECLALIMPSTKSNPKNIEDAKNISDMLGIKYEIIPLSEFERAYLNTHSFNHSNQQSQSTHTSPTQIEYGNFCARLRMALLYDRSQKLNSLVIGTSNKTELLLGYGTIFGDLACGVNPIASFYKTEIFLLAKLLSIPEEIILKPPSADLFPNQTDEQDLGYKYEEIDEFLKTYEKFKHSKELQSLLIQRGYDEKMVTQMIRRIKKNSFKRRMPEFFIWPSTHAYNEK